MWFIQHIPQVSVSLGIITFLTVLGFNYFAGTKSRLEYLLVRVLAASCVPTAIALICCAFDPQLILEMTGVNIHIACAGLALLYMAVKGMLAQTPTKA